MILSLPEYDRIVTDSLRPAGDSFVLLDGTEIAFNHSRREWQDNGLHGDEFVAAMLDEHSALWLHSCGTIAHSSPMNWPADAVECKCAPSELPNSGWRLLRVQVGELGDTWHEFPEHVRPAESAQPEPISEADAMPSGETPGEFYAGLDRR